VQVQTLNGRPAGWLKGLIRGTLTMLILPAVIMDSDARGIHDRICKTVLVRIR
jgi:RDD family domain protein